MGLTSPELALLAVELLTALALAVLWMVDRERPYTLWWAISHVSLPLPSLLAGQYQNYVFLAAILTCANVAVQSSTLIAGVISYRAQRKLRPSRVIAAVVVLTLLYYVPTQFVGVAWARFTLVLSMAVALLASAVLMWTLGNIERLAAVCFALRGGFEFWLLALFVTGRGNSASFAHVPSFHALLAICTALALLIAAYQRSLTLLRNQYGSLALSQEITTQLQGVTDETDLAQRVLAVMTQRMAWKEGVFLSVVGMADAPKLVPIARCGTDDNLLNIGVPIEMPDEGMTLMAIRTRRICYSSNLMIDPRVPAIYRARPTVPTHPSAVMIPVLNDSNVLGVIALRDAVGRQLSSTETRTLESLGQMIGLSLTNTRNLQELAYRANHDTLTGLGNRAALHDCLSEKAGDRYVVMLFDLDHFKQVNDSLGHAVGDKLLRAMAERVQQFLQERPAQLFRLGGDEFVIIHAFAALAMREQALELANELAQVIALPLLIGDLSLRTSASIGVALPEHGDNSHELLRCADVAMYHAKQSGTGVAFYERDIDAYKLEHLTLLSAVTEGLNKNQFALFYQPIINLATGAIEGCEGLIRWHHPTLGLVGAAEFMPLVESTDMIRSITHRVIHIAMADAARWQQRGIDTRIAINLSARNILDPELPHFLLNAAAQHRMDPRKIQLEITETILIKDPDSASKVLQKLAEAGFSLALDDFGTGYSSMSYLARFPIHVLKIDRSFVSEMLTQTQSRAIIEMTIALARGLGLKVTAEGVELEAEARMLRELGCDAAQGFLYSQPIPESELMAKWWGGALTV